MAMGFWHGQEGRDTFCSFDFTPKSIVMFKKKFGIVKNKALPWCVLNWEVKGSSKESISVSGHFMARSVTPKWKIKKGNPFNRHLQLKGNCTRLPRCCHHLFLLFSDVTWFICFQRFKLSKIYDLIPISTSTKFTPFISFQARRWWWICWLFVQKIHQPLCWGGGTWDIYLLLRCGSFVGSVEFQDRKR